MKWAIYQVGAPLLRFGSNLRTIDIFVHRKPVSYQGYSQSWQELLTVSQHDGYFIIREAFWQIVARLVAKSIVECREGFSGLGAEDVNLSKGDCQQYTTFSLPRQEDAFGGEDRELRRFGCACIIDLMSKSSLTTSIVATLILGLLAGCASPVEETSLPRASATPSPTRRIPALTPTATPEQPLAATVNGQPIFLTDYQKEIARFEAAMVGQGFDLESEDGKAMLTQMRRQVLDSMIEQVLIKQAAAEEGMTISEEELEAAVQKSIEEGGGQAGFEEWLQASDLTYEDFREEFRFQLLAQAIFEQVTGSIPTTGEQVRARHIVVNTKEEAQAILTRLQAGEDFAALAKQHSQDENTKEAGGDLGYFHRGQLISPEIEEAAFALQSDQISGVVQSQFGYHIIQVLEKVPDRPLPPELLNSLKEQAFARWMQEQWDSATIERFID
jgi:parvulin-like peptidyl-prolyl isomerase